MRIEILKSIGFQKIVLGLVLILSGCGMGELKKITPETQKELNVIMSELKLESVDYGVFKKNN